MTAGNNRAHAIREGCDFGRRPVQAEPVHECSGESVARTHGIDHLYRVYGRFDIDSAGEDGATAITQCDSDGPPSIAGRPFAAESFGAQRESRELVDALEFLLVELDHIGTQQQFTDEFRGIGSRAKVQVVEFCGTPQSAETLMQDVLARRGRSEQRTVIKPSRCALNEKIEIMSGKVQSVICGRPWNRELRRVSGRYLGGASGKPQCRLKKASIEIQSVNHLSGLPARLIRTHGTDQGNGMAQPARVNAEV